MVIDERTQELVIPSSHLPKSTMLFGHRTQLAHRLPDFDVHHDVLVDLAPKDVGSSGDAVENPLDRHLGIELLVVRSDLLWQGLRQF